MRQGGWCPAVARVRWAACFLSPHGMGLGHVRQAQPCTPALMSSPVSRQNDRLNLHSLNPPQRSAVETLSGPLLVLAGAGTGKTRVVTYRIAHLMGSGIRGSRILAVTFTNKAAGEMKQRVRALLDRKQKDLPQVSTFHAHCLTILRRHIHLLGYPKKFAIYDRGDQESVARGVLREIKVPGALMRPSDLLFFISSWKMNAVRPNEAANIAKTDKEHLASAAYRRYQRALKNAGAVDFDDLLLCTEELFGKFADVRREEAGRFDHLLVDEYQDTNGTQYRIVRALAQGHRNLCVVGDDDQSIYGWRGAEVAHILRFKRDWPEAKSVRLEDNYRSTEAILELANRLIVFNRNRFDKTLRAARPGGERPRILQFEDEELEAEEIVADIRRRISDPSLDARDVAILFRTNEQPRLLETELRKRDVPYVLIGGMSFFDRKEVRDILAYLKVIDTPTDEVSLLRVINTPPRGIGQKTVETLMAHAVQKGVPIWEVLPYVAQMPGITPAATAALTRFVTLVRAFQDRLENESLVDVLNGLITQIRYAQELERIYPDANERQSRLDAVEQVVNAVGSYESQDKTPTVGGFLDETVLGGRELDRDKEKQLGRNAVALMTMHSAKGLEFPHVYMVGMEEGILPHHRSVKAEGDAIDEERRLCYVGITRAQDRLTLSLALSRMKWGKPRSTDPSRFLFEITGKADNPHATENG